MGQILLRESRRAGSFRAGLHHLVGAGIGLALLAGPGAALADPVTGDIFFTRHAATADPTRVGKITFSYDGATTFSLSGYTTLATGIGADGIAGNPQDAGSLLIGGQTTTVWRVSKTGAGVLESTAVPGAAFHTEVPNSTTLYTTGIPGTVINSTTINPDGSFGSTSAITIAGSETSITQVITTPGGSFYTNSSPNGFGTYGSLSIAGGVATATRFYGAGGLKGGSNLVAAHGGTYDPFTDSVILFGENHVTQLDLAGNIIADLVLAGGLNIDQGTVDGKGHAYAAAEGTGSLLFIDYSASGLVNSVGNFVTTAFVAANLDDVAPLVGAGTTTKTPAPASLAALGFGLAALGWLRRRRRAR